MTPSQIRPGVTYELVKPTGTPSGDWPAGTEVRYAGRLATDSGDQLAFRRSDDYLGVIDPGNLRLAFAGDPEGAGPTAWGFDADECDDPSLGDAVLMLAHEMPEGITVTVSVKRDRAPGPAPGPAAGADDSDTDD